MARAFVPPPDPEQVRLSLLLGRGDIAALVLRKLPAHLKLRLQSASPLKPIDSRLDQIAPYIRRVMKSYLKCQEDIPKDFKVFCRCSRCGETFRMPVRDFQFYCPWFHGKSKCQGWLVPVRVYEPRPRKAPNVVKTNHVPAEPKKPYHASYDRNGKPRKVPYMKSW